MKLSKIKELLPTLQNVEFQLENGAFVPEYFHVTEIGIVTKHFIDCGEQSEMKKRLTSSYGMLMTLSTG